MKTGVVALFMVVHLASPASTTAACADWSPEARVVLEDPPRVTLGDGGLRGMHFEFSLVTPLPKMHATRHKETDFIERIEVVDERGEPVFWYRTPSLIHLAPFEMWMRPGKRATLHVPPYWVDLPRGGTYRIRAGFTFRDLPVGFETPEKRGVPRPACEHWSEWTTVDFHPVDVSGEPYGAILSPGASRARVHGVLWVDRPIGEVYWIFSDLEAREVRRVYVGTTSEDPRGAALSDFGFKDLDARVDAAGHAHILYAVPGGKTAYVKMGAKGVVLERKEYVGKKKLGGPSHAITVVDKPASPSKKP